MFLAVWECPHKSTLTKDSHSLCHPLHSVFNKIDPYVSPYVEQYVSPYYNQYAAPYAVPAQKMFQTKVATPLVKHGHKVYKTHLHPVVVKQGGKVKVVAQPWTDKAAAIYSTHLEPLRTRAEKCCKQYMGPTVKISKEYFDRFNTYVFTPAYFKLFQYTQSSFTYFQANATPVIIRYSKIVYQVLSEYARLFWNWLVSLVSPRITTVYNNAIEPQVNKIIDRIFQDTETLISKSITAGTSATVPGEATATTPSSSVVISASTEANFTTTHSEEPVATPLYNTEKPIDQPTGFDGDQVPIKKIEITEELKNWKRRVEETRKEAFDTFEKEVAAEKERLIQQHKPEISKTLQGVQKHQRELVTEATEIVNQMEVAFESDESTEVESKVFPWTTHQNEVTFRSHTQNIEVGSVEVEQLGENLRKEAEESIEAIRQDHLKILEEFSDITIAAVAQKMVSIDDISSSTASNGKATWDDWKEFRHLKELLSQARQDLIDHKVSLQEIDVVVSQIRTTAYILSQDASSQLNQLKGKADYLVIAHRNKVEDRLKELGKELPQEEDYDIIYYEELEDGEEGTTDDSLEATKDAAAAGAAINAGQKVIAKESQAATDNVVSVAEDEATAASSSTSASTTAEATSVQSDDSVDDEEEEYEEDDDEEIEDGVEDVDDDDYVVVDKEAEDEAEAEAEEDIEDAAEEVEDEEVEDDEYETVEVPQTLTKTRTSVVTVSQGSDEASAKATAEADIEAAAEDDEDVEYETVKVSQTLTKTRTKVVPVSSSHDEL